jgi:hypothetical protein
MKPQYLLIDLDDKTSRLMPTVELAKFIEANPENEDDIDLLEIPAQRWETAQIEIVASLQEAYELFESGGQEALYVARKLRSGKHRVYGILTRDMVEKAYRY